MNQLLELWFCKTVVCLLIIGGKSENSVLSVPIEFDDIDSAYDLDTEQSEARYDPRLLSQELQTSDLDSQGAAESCISANRSYEHGAKLPRLDPCEICLCIDGEVFCWWKQCEIPIKKPSKTKLKKPTSIKSHSKSLNFSSKSMENVPNSILSFPQNLPLHLSMLNDTEEKINKKFHSPKKYSLPILSTTTTTVSSSTKPSKVGKFINKLQAPKQHIVEANNKFNIPENILNSNIPPIIINTKYADTYQPSFQTTENNLPNTNTNFLQSPPSHSEKYQINNQTTLHAHQPTHFHKTPQHYIITSSGNIEMDPELDDNDGDNDDLMTNVLEFNNKNDNIDDNYQKYVNDWNDNEKMSDNNNSEQNDNINYNSTKINENLSSVSAASEQRIINQQMSATVSQNKPTKQYNASEILFSTLTDTSATVSPATDMLMVNKVSAVILAETTTIIDTTTYSREKTCIVMGKIYGIGSILPQETGNCLQCICTEGINIDDPPRVTCNPHNCPPLVLPDLFDNTGY